MKKKLQAYLCVHGQHELTSSGKELTGKCKSQVEELCMAGLQKSRCAGVSTEIEKRQNKQPLSMQAKTEAC